MSVLEPGEKGVGWNNIGLIKTPGEQRERKRDEDREARERSRRILREGQPIHVVYLEQVNELVVLEITAMVKREKSATLSDSSRCSHVLELT